MQDMSFCRGGKCTKQFFSDQEHNAKRKEEKVNHRMLCRVHCSSNYRSVIRLKVNQGVQAMGV